MLNRGIYRVLLLAGLLGGVLLPVGQALEVEEIVSANMGAVVIIYGTNAKTGATVQGSGVCVDPRGLVLVTAHQVVGVEDIHGNLRSGEKFRFEVLEAVPEQELAILQADRPMPLGARVGAAKRLVTGATLVAIASPEDLAFTAVTGIVSRPDTTYQGYAVFLATLSATHGSSGAPVFDRAGQLVGLISGEVEDFDELTIVNAIENAYPLLGKQSISIPNAALPESSEVELVPVSGISEREFRAIEAFNTGVYAGYAAEKVDAYTKATQLLPAFYEAHFNLALAHLAAHEPALAEASYKAASELRPDALEVKRNLGRLYLSSKRIQDAIAVFGAALKLAPNDAQAHNDLGEAYRQAGDVTRALEHFGEALKINPRYSAAHFNAALTCANANKAAEAIAHFRQYLELTPEASDTEQVKAWISELEKAA